MFCPFKVVFWFRIRCGSRQAKIVPKKEKIKKFHVWRVICWAGGFSWSMKVLFNGLKHDVFLIKQILKDLCLDPDLDWAKCRIRIRYTSNVSPVPYLCRLDVSWKWVLRSAFSWPTSHTIIWVSTVGYWRQSKIYAHKKFPSHGFYWMFHTAFLPRHKTLKHWLIVNSFKKTIVLNHKGEGGGGRFPTKQCLRFKFKIKVTFTFAM